MEKEDKYLEEIVNEVLAEEPRALLEIQAGMRSSLDNLVAKVMRRTKVKVESRKVRDIILSKL